MTVLSAAKTAGYKWFVSTKSAAWVLSTSFIVLIVPMILSMERESNQEDAASAMHTLTGGEKKS